MRKIILASFSARRKQLLEMIGLKFEVIHPDFEESMDLNMKPEELAKHLSLKKAEVVAKKFPNVLIISADTFIVLNGKLFGKARNVHHAKKMLKELSGKPHQVITGFTIIDTINKKIINKHVETKVWMKNLTDDEIDWYIKTGEPIGAAGAYFIQNKGSVLIEKIEGDYFNIVGLPIFSLINELKKFAINI